MLRSTINFEIHVIGRRSGFLVFLGLAACASSEHGAKAPTIKTDSAAGQVVAARPDSTAAVRADSPASAPGTPGAPQAIVKMDVDKDYPIVRALYVNRTAAESKKRFGRLIEIADQTEINAFVIDMKDEFGLNYKTGNAEWAKNGGNAGYVHDLKGMLDTLRAHHILAIARLVTFKDSVTARVHPEWTIRKQDGTPWRDKKGVTWVNPYHHELWDYNIGLAEELAKMGFGEIQFDYIRFPEPYPSLPTQVFPDSKGVAKPDLLAAFLKEANARIDKYGSRTTADIFGLVTTVGGPLEVGQWWEKVSPQLDVVLPMVYPSHYPRGDLGLAVPNAEPYKVLKISLSKAKERDAKLGITKPEHVRPWLQAFTLGKPAYGAAEIEAQKKGAYDAGYDGWVLWNPGSKYEPFVPAFEKELISRKVK